MKKSLYFAMFAAVALASCSSNDTVENIVEDEVAIDFEGDIQNATRAEITSVEALQTPGFAVFGYKFKDGLTWSDWSSTAGNVIFKDVKVSGASWTYTGTKYWDKTASYNFYAVAPYEETNPNYTIAANGRFTIKNVASGLAADSKDYIIDRDGATAVSGNYTSTHAKVGFDFHHTMAKIDFKLAKKSGITDALVVKKVTMSGWKNGTGTFTQTATATPSSLENSEWAITATTTGSVDVLDSSDGETVTTANTYNTNTYIMVPQDIAADALTFTIDYTLGGEPFTAQTAALSTKQIWGTDSHITYTLTIGPAAIEFEVTDLCGFCNEGTGAGTVN